MTIIPAILIEESSGKIILYGLLYIVFAVYTSNILVIPTFEFFSFPFLNYNDPLSHIYTFKFFFENETSDENIEFKSDEIISKNNNYINIIFIIIEVLYSLSYIMGLLSITTIFQDVVEIIILTCVYIYYLIIFFGYFIISIYAIFKCYKFKKKIVPDINLLSYSFNPNYDENYNISNSNNKNNNKTLKNPFLHR